MTTLSAILFQLMISLSMWVPGVMPVMPNAALTAVEQRYNQDLDARRALIDQMAALETQHQTLVNRISRLKQAETTLTNRLTLEDLLRQSKEIADRLLALQTQTHQLDQRLDNQRRQIVSGLEAEMKGLERSLAQVPAAQRGAVVEQLNTLRATRTEFSAPLPAAPRVRDLHAALTLADRAEAPDELLAAADELLDSESQLQRRLAAIDQRLNELQQAQRLNRRAASFSREERFFEETDRDRVIARYEKTTSIPKDNAAPGQTDTPTSANNANESDDSASQNNSSANNFNAPEFDGAPAVGNVADPVTDSRGTPQVAPNNEDLFVDATTTVVINTSVDPSRSVGNANAATTQNVDLQIDQLAKEKARLKKQADALRKQAEDLQRRAQNL